MVTGAASGIGAAVARACTARGDRVVTVDWIKGDVVADLSTAAGRAAAVSEIEALGGVDAIAACAGLAEGDPGTIVGVNYFGAIELVAKLRPLLAKGNAPRAVIISSEALILDQHPATVAACLAGDEPAAVSLARANPTVVYQSSKLAVSLWVKREAVKSEWAGDGILLNAVAPGVVDTPMVRGFLATEEGTAFLNKATPMRLGRPAQPIELANLISFLIGTENTFIVGQTVFCDGGAEATLRPDHI